MLQRFLPLFVMTFFICLFVVMMQFLFMRIDELVGKGLAFSIIAELFFYAAVSMVPTALPLAVLLASLMTFGNLGEKFELTAMKAAGISLFRIMSPLIVFMVLVAIGAFFFQNNVLPIAQTKMYTLMFSVRQKTPEVEIPEKLFYDEIPGMNLYVDRKNPETGMLYGMIIYDLSKGSDNARVILADSGKFSFTEDKTHLFLHLYSGEMFENLNDRSMAFGTSGYMPFRRESFTDKQVYFVFDANFNRLDEEGIRSQYVGQNISQLRASIDSIGHRVDSIGTIYANELRSASYVGISNRSDNSPTSAAHSSLARARGRKTVNIGPDDLDSVFSSPTPSFAKTYLTQALADSKRVRQDFEYRSIMLAEQARLMRRHDIELQRKFTLSFACLVFFFIGAPLGAIIKKGGLGTPLVISVMLFIVYFIFDNMGFKMASTGKMPVWQGIWLSSAVLLPLGIFFTYKAVGDSAVFNVDAYIAFFNRLRGRRPQRTLELKEVIMNEVEADVAVKQLQNLLQACKVAEESVAKRPRFLHFLSTPQVRAIHEPLGQVVDYLSNSRNPIVINLLNRFPFEPRPSDLGMIADTARQLLQRFDKNNDPINDNDNPHGR